MHVSKFSLIFAVILLGLGLSDIFGDGTSGMLRAGGAILVCLFLISYIFDSELTIYDQEGHGPAEH